MIHHHTSPKFVNLANELGGIFNGFVFFSDYNMIDGRAHTICTDDLNVATIDDLGIDLEQFDLDDYAQLHKARMVTTYAAKVRGFDAIKIENGYGDEILIFNITKCVNKLIKIGEIDMNKTWYMNPETGSIDTREGWGDIDMNEVVEIDAVGFIIEGLNAGGKLPKILKDFGIKYSSDRVLIENFGEYGYYAIKDATDML